MHSTFGKKTLKQIEKFGRTTYFKTNKLQKQEIRIHFPLMKIPETTEKSF